MKDNHPEAIRVTLGGKERIIKHSVGAFRIAKLKHGVDFALSDLTSFRFDTISTLIWIGLLPHEPELKEDDVMVWLAQSDEEAEIIRKTFESFSRFVEQMAAFTEGFDTKKKAAGADKE